MVQTLSSVENEVLSMVLRLGKPLRRIKQCISFKRFPLKQNIKMFTNQNIKLSVGQLFRHVRDGDFT